VTRYEVTLYIGPCTEDEAETLMDAIIDLPEARAVGAGAVGLTPFEEPAASSVSAGAGQSPLSERAHLEWWLDKLEDPDFHFVAADRGTIAHLVRNVLTAVMPTPEKHTDKERAL
jgi:hypothetical protein